MFGRRIASALLVDFDNIVGMLGGVFPGSVANWMSWLEDGALSKNNLRRKFLAKKVYWNSMNDKYRDIFEDAGFEAFRCEAMSPSKMKSTKSSADIVLTIDAMDVANTFGRTLDEVIILSADTDFVPLANKLQDMGLRVATAGKETDRSLAIYRDHADAVFHGAALRAATTYVSPSRRFRWKRPQVPVAPVDTPPPKEATPLPVAKAAPDKKLVSKKARGHQTVKRAGPAPPPFNLEIAATLIVDLARQTADRPVSRANVLRVLQQVDGFTPVGLRGVPVWLGQGSYKQLLRKIKELRPELGIRKTSNGGENLIFVGPPQMANSESTETSEGHSLFDDPQLST